MSEINTSKKITKKSGIPKKSSESKKNEDKRKTQIKEKIEKKIFEILKEEKKNTSKINIEVIKLIDKEVIIDYSTNQKVNAKSIINKYLHIIQYLMKENAQLRKNQKYIISESTHKKSFIEKLENELKNKDAIIEALIRKIKANGIVNDTFTFPDTHIETVEKENRPNEHIKVLVDANKEDTFFLEMNSGNEKKKNSVITFNNFSIRNSQDILNPYNLEYNDTSFPLIEELKETKQKNIVPTYSNNVNKNLCLEKEESNFIYPFTNNKDTTLDKLENLINMDKTNVENILNCSEKLREEFEANKRRIAIIMNEMEKTKRIMKKEHIQKNENGKMEKNLKEHFSFVNNLEEKSTGELSTDTIKMSSDKKGNANNSISGDENINNIYTNKQNIQMKENVQELNASNVIFEKKEVIESEKENEKNEQENLENVMSIILKFREKSVVIED